MNTIPFYYAVFERQVGNSTITLQWVDDNSHPFVLMYAQKNLGIDWVVTYWKEISADEYTMYKNLKLGKFSNV